VVFVLVVSFQGFQAHTFYFASYLSMLITVDLMNINNEVLSCRAWMQK